MEIHDRLKIAREEAGYASAAEAARAMGVSVPTYNGHENGTTPPPRDAVVRYAIFFQTTTDYLLRGIRPPKRRLVKVVGKAAAGAQFVLYSDGQADPNDVVEGPVGTTDETVAVELDGQSLGPFFDRWLVFYDDQRAPVTPDMLGKLCVLGLADGRVVIKRLAKGRDAFSWTLLSQFDAPIYDAEVMWGAIVKGMKPR